MPTLSVRARSVVRKQLQEIALGTSFEGHLGVKIHGRPKDVGFEITYIHLLDPKDMQLDSYSSV